MTAARLAPEVFPNSRHRVMRVVRVALAVVLGLALAGVVFLHAVSETWAFNLGWNPRAEQGDEQQQFYLQGVREAGTLLAGWRGETKMSDVPFPEFFWTLGKPVANMTGAGPSPDTSSLRSYTGGVCLQSSDRPEEGFHARYLYVRFWLPELVLGLLLAAVLVPLLLKSRQTPPPQAAEASRPGGASK